MALGDSDDLEAQESRTIPLLDETSTINDDNVAARQGRSLWRRLVVLVKENRAQNGGQLPAAYVPLPTEGPQTIIDIHEESETNNTVIGTTTTTDAKNQPIAKIVEIVKTKNLVSLHQIGGVKGAADALNIDLEAGISGDQEDLNRRTGQTNLDYPCSGDLPSPSFFRILQNNCNDLRNMILAIAAMLSIGFGIKKDGPETGWYEGVFIIIAMIILIVAPTLHDLWQLRCSRKVRILLEEKVTVWRNSSEEKLYAYELVQGDIVVLSNGCSVPADGLFIKGEFLVVHDGLESTVDEEEPFLFHGSTVTHGKGRMLVTTVGKDTEFSKLTSLTATSDEISDSTTRLPAQLERLTRVTDIVGLLLCVLIPIVLFVRFTKGRHDDDSDLPQFKGKSNNSNEVVDFIERIFRTLGGNKGANIVTLLAAAIVGVVEGTRLIIFICMLWRKTFLSNKVSDPGLLSSLTMGSTTVIITDKTLLNPIDVTKCFIGNEEVVQTVRSNPIEIATSIREYLGVGISAPLVIPSSPRKEEDPLLAWGNSNLGIELHTLWQSSTVMKIKRLSSNEEGSRVLLKKPETEHMSLHLKGPASTILGKCSSYYDKNGTVKDLDGTERAKFGKFIEEMQSQHLKTVAFASKKIDALVGENDDVMDEAGLSLIATIGIQEYTCSAKSQEELKSIEDAQVRLILASGDDMSVVEKMADACKILRSGGLVITGEDFRNYEEKRMDIADKICVMGNSNPSDRQLLTACLKSKGHVVLGLGSRIEDIPMQRQANLSVAMGNRSCHMVKVFSKLAVFDGSLNSLLTLIQCGRCTNYNIQKYIQLELVTNIAGTLIASITTMLLGSNSITGIQLFWTNLVTTFVLGPALLMEPPNSELMRRPPIRPNDFIISKPMRRNMIIQVICQTTFLVTFQFSGHHLLHLFGIQHNGQQRVSTSIIFNSFVLCQIFNLLNSRELEKINVWKGINRNPWFPLAVVLALGLQASFTEVAHAVNGDKSLSLAQWGVCFILGIVSCLVDMVAKCTVKTSYY